VRDLAALTAADFEPLIGTDFEVFASPVPGCDLPGSEMPGPPGAPVLVIRLVEVHLLPEWPGHRQPFVLHFTGPASPVLAQQIHRLTHSSMGELELFLGPVVSATPGITYEAVFA
jgi:hypothetical protein